MKKLNKTFRASLLSTALLSSLVMAHDHGKDHQHDNHKGYHVDHEHGKVTSEPAYDLNLKGGKVKEIVPKDLVPEAPILNLEQALKRFDVHPDFELEVIASEPMVFDPIIAIHDAKGRLWVVEMTTYMPNLEGVGEMEHESQIVMLTDTDNDGKMDKRQVVLEKLLLPRTLAFVEKGILWADHTTLHFSELAEDGDKVKVVNTEVVDKTYAASGSVEHKPNGMLYSLDNWYYNSYATSRYRALPLDIAVPSGAKEVYRNKYWKMVKGATEFRGAWSITQDDYGRHYFNGNSTPIRITPYSPSISLRNPKHHFSPELLVQEVGTDDVYPIRVTPAIYAGDVEASYRDGYRLARHTASCGTLVYRGNQFPEKYQGIGLVNEPTANLTKATKITDTNGVVTGENLLHQREIVASTDERYRPVNTHNAPDGTVTIVDFYHGIIQHGKFMNPYLADQIKQRDLERHKHIGRLYRLKAKGKATNNETDLTKYSPAELVPFLGHANGWHRDMAQQLLVMKQDKSVVKQLTQMALTDNNHLAKIKALWVLEGLHATTVDTLKQAAENGNEKVKVAVYRILDTLPASAEVATWLNQQAKTVSKEALSYLALAAGTHNAWPAIATVINQHGVSDPVFAALGSKEAEFLKAQGNNIPETAKADVTKIMNFVDVTAGKNKKLSGRALDMIKFGQKLYNGKAGCSGCHGVDGNGNSSIPPLNGSEWVTGDKAKFLAIVMHGLSGPVEVKGKTYNSVMPATKYNTAIGTNEMAALTSYIRFAWSNEASFISKTDVKTVKDATKKVNESFTVETFKRLKDCHQRQKQEKKQ